MRAACWRPAEPTQRCLRTSCRRERRSRKPVASGCHGGRATGCRCQTGHLILCVRQDISFCVSGWQRWQRCCAAVAQAGGRVERIQRAALGGEEARAAIERDAPELLTLLDELQESLQEVRSRVGPVLQQVPALLTLVSPPRPFDTSTHSGV